MVEKRVVLTCTKCFNKISGHAMTENVARDQDWHDLTCPYCGNKSFTLKFLKNPDGEQGVHMHCVLYKTGEIEITSDPWSHGITSIYFRNIDELMKLLETSPKLMKKLIELFEKKIIKTSLQKELS